MRIPWQNLSWKERFAKFQPPASTHSEVEDSLLLRVLVQILVAIGIIATDFAAETQMSLGAIPVSFIGAAWSWHRRRRSNVAVKFFIAVGMIVALGNFFGNLVSNLNDTRLVLAELLIYLQVLHSFDLPRRKDLGYSIVIGLILLGAAATLWQTLAFAPMLLVFLLLALPTMVLDYKSRLGLTRQDLNLPRQSIFSWQPDSSLSLKRLGGFFLVVLGLGLVIFALMPRFPGYQLRTFPVGSPIELADRGFESDGGDRRIINPGYVSEGEGNGSGGGAVKPSPNEGSGRINPSFYYGFSDKINQNLRGMLEPQVVMRVRSQARAWTRVLAFDTYTGQGWEISSDEEEFQDVTRPRWSYRFRLIGGFSRARSESIVQTYTIVSDLPNIIPAVSEPRDLYFPTQEVAVDPLGNLRSPVGLLEGLTYTVVSRVPYRDRSLLREAGTDYPKKIAELYLQVPDAVAPQLRQKTEELLATSTQPLTSAYEKALYLAQALKQNYEIQPNLPFLAEDEDLATSFLFRFNGGYPDHFSTTLTMMLRSLGIPARLATGFGSGEFNPFTGLYVVRNTDAYALTEVYFPQYGWFAFDPIPGHEVLPPSIEESETFTVLRQFWSWIAGWLPSPVTGFLVAAWDIVIGGAVRILARVWVFFASSWFGALSATLSLVAIAFLGWLGFEQFKQWRYRRWLHRLDPVERVYQRMLRMLAVHGYVKHPAQTPIEYARTLAPSLEAASAEIVAAVAIAYAHWRYGDELPNLDYLAGQLQGLSRSLGRIGS